MKVIFLDVDGVLNHEDSLEHNIQLDPAKVLMIHQLAKETKAKVVLSSTWRIGDKRFEALKLALWWLGFNAHNYRDIDRTIFEGYGNTDRHGTRGYEIQKYLDTHGEITHYVIIDDDADMLDSQQDHFVQTNAVNGLTRFDFFRARRILNEVSMEK